jgi:hypothetical protein
MTPYSPAPVGILIRHLKLAMRTSAEIQDLYSRPLVAPERRSDAQSHS